MTDTIRIPVPLLEEVELALNEAVRFKYRGKLQNNSYSLVAMIERYRRTGSQPALDQIVMDADQPDRCPKCGIRPEALDNPEWKPPVDVWCPGCGYVFTLVED